MAKSFGKFDGPGKEAAVAVMRAEISQDCKTISVDTGSVAAENKTLKALFMFFSA